MDSVAMRGISLELAATRIGGAHKFAIADKYQAPSWQEECGLAAPNCMKEPELDELGAIYVIDPDRGEVVLSARMAGELRSA